MNQAPTVDKFAATLSRTFGMETEDARELGEVVLSTFEGHEEVADDTLDAELRSVFYTLEAKRILSFRRVEFTREDGDRRRAFYWRLREESLEARGHPVPVSGPEDVYASLPADAWAHAG